MVIENFLKKKKKAIDNGRLPFACFCGIWPQIMIKINRTFLVVSWWDSLPLVNDFIFSLFLSFLFSGCVPLKYFFLFFFFFYMIWKETWSYNYYYYAEQFFVLQPQLWFWETFHPPLPFFPLSWLDAKGQQSLHLISVWILCYSNVIFALNPSPRVAYFNKRNKCLDASNMWEWGK